SSLLFFLFFLSRSVHHLDLLSFPTRRSSDLPLVYKKQYLDRLWTVIRSRVEELRAGHCAPDKYLVPGARALLEDLRDRGLEVLEIGKHTSELQSRFDLVCRLLLEKKNHRNKL